MPDKTVDDYILQQPELQQKLLKALQFLVKDSAPALVESIKWGMPAYTGKRNVCYLASQKRHVNLGFYEGALLPEARIQLEGTGTKMRHVKIRTLTEIEEKPLRELILKAVAFQDQ